MLPDINVTHGCDGLCHAVDTAIALQASCEVDLSQLFVLKGNVPHGIPLCHYSHELLQCAVFEYKATCIPSYIRFNIHVFNIDR